MHLRSILAIARKDALDILLNKSTLFMLLTPIFLALLFLVLGGLLGNHSTNVLVYNPGKSGVEQILDKGLSNVKVTYANSPMDVAAAFGPDGSHKDTSYAVGLVVPPDFDTSLKSGGHPQMSLYVDGSQISNQERALLLSAITDYSRSLANPQPPAIISVATVNPPQENAALQDITQVYAVTALLSSLLVGTSLVPGLIIEEKEKKTLRMLMVSPASFTDFVLAKLLVGFTYQLLLGLVALAITKGFTGQIPLLLLFALLGSCFSVSLGLIAGSLFQTTNASGAFAGSVSFLYIIPIFFVGPFAQLLGSNPFTQIVKVLPTYYIADGAVSAITNSVNAGGILLDIIVVAACIVALVMIAAWLLRRQASIVSTI
jgi:ABC-2 type transport system permease protein